MGGTAALPIRRYIRYLPALASPFKALMMMMSWSPSQTCSCRPVQGYEYCAIFDSDFEPPHDFLLVRAVLRWGTAVQCCAVAQHSPPQLPSPVSGCGTSSALYMVSSTHVQQWLWTWLQGC